MLSNHFILCCPLLLLLSIFLSKLKIKLYLEMIGLESFPARKITGLQTQMSWGSSMFRGSKMLDLGLNNLNMDREKAEGLPLCHVTFSPCHFWLHPRPQLIATQKIPPGLPGLSLLPFTPCSCLLQFSFLGELETPSVSPWVTGAKSRTEGQFGCGQWINERNRSNMQRLHWQWGAFRSGVCKGLRWPLIRPEAPWGAERGSAG